MSEQMISQTTPQRRFWLMVLPLIVFLVLAAMFWLRLLQSHLWPLYSYSGSHQRPPMAVITAGNIPLKRAGIDMEHSASCATESGASTRPRGRRP
jgi:hypothetical protein